MGRREETNRITLRLPQSILQVLKKESDERILPLNAIINRILTKHVMFDMRINKLSNISTHQDFLSLIIEKLDKFQKEELAEHGPQMVKKYFTLLDLEYTIPNVIDEYFSMLGKYCGWYKFHCELDHNRYRLIFESKLGKEWLMFLSLYVGSILRSLRVHIDKEWTDDSILVIEFIKA
jgi:hypothetical protein